MPDEAKHKALAAVGFRLVDACCVCEFWSPTALGWGLCSEVRYEHKKHSGEKVAGVPGLGVCRQFLRGKFALTAAAGPDYVSRYARKDTPSA